MPIFAGIVAGLFGKIFEFFAVRVSYQVSLAAAFAATSIIAIAALKVALAVVWAAVPTVVPAAVVSGVGMFMPANLQTCITAVVLVDVIASSYDYWRQTAGLALGAAGR